MRKEQIEITIEDGQAKDAKDLLAFYQHVGQETDYLSFGEEGLGLNQEQEQRYLKQVADSDNNRVLIARLGGDIIGVASIGAEAKAKLAHIGEIGICVKQAYWGFGISRVLIGDLIDWAIENPVLTYLKLEVFHDNKRAIGLYEKFDFTELGRTPQGLAVKGQPGETIIMGRSVTAE
ncbi:GNAT family acetyltransferase [Aerococcus urinaehominis]|uniref:GNAT family acetyltransferase n=1 Tax=Aerococcus urinaehominis TaxID=128944 RepID=A0A0X8FKE1_9LACT|nr:GNAT family N-acetyltransferase [Aerococcus urinaehominis]AMB98925.1 GNAT family acetyltransferase [Aerococcus urinaehominis]SDM39851.1 Acetyltransferase (GNAT) family protein [Aerococcus urinaehominis]